MLSILKGQSYIPLFSSPRLLIAMPCWYRAVQVLSYLALGPWHANILHCKNLTICQVRRYHHYCGSQAREGCMLHQFEQVPLLGHTCVLCQPCITPNKKIKTNCCSQFLLAPLLCKFSIQYHSWVKSAVPNQGITQYCLLGQDISETWRLHTASSTAEFTPDTWTFPRNE